jgi:hypothetical protein
MIIAEDTSNNLTGKIKVHMFKITKFNLCMVGMVVGIGLISALPFMGLSCRWCTPGV